MTKLITPPAFVQKIKPLVKRYNGIRYDKPQLNVCFATTRLRLKLWINTQKRIIKLEFVDK